MYACGIFFLTLILVIWQPWGLSYGVGALAGATLALLVGVVTLNDIPLVWEIVGNANLTLVALAIVALILDEAGLFRFLAFQVVLGSWGKGRLLFPFVMLLGAAVTAVFTNDGMVLVLTPIVMTMLIELEFSPKATLAFVMACGFITSATSLPLVVSNFVNVITADYFGISFGKYALVMIPVNLVAIAISLSVLWFYFDPYIPDSYRLPHQKPHLIRDPLVFRSSPAILSLLLGGYFLAEPLNIPISAIAILAAVVMLALAGRWFRQPKTARVIDLRLVLRQAPWQVVLFSSSMYLIVIGLSNAGLTTPLSLGLEQLSRWGLTLATVGTGFLATLLSGVMNNLPAVLVNAIALQNAADIDPATREAMTYANAIGCALGAKITPIGSLSTLVGLEVLARKGIHISWGQYLQFGIALTLPVLFITLLSLSIWVRWLVI